MTAIKIRIRNEVIGVSPASIVYGSLRHKGTDSAVCQKTNPDLAFWEARYQLGSCTLSLVVSIQYEIFNASRVAGSGFSGCTRGNVL